MISKYNDTLIYNSKDEYVRAVKHEYCSYLNSGKNNFINNFILEYRRVMKICLDELWNKNYTYEIKNRQYNFHIQRKIFNGGIPKYLQTSKFNCLKNYKGFLSGRMLSCMVSQLSSIIRSQLSSNKSLNITKLKKPDLHNIIPIIQPKHLKFIENSNKNSIFKNLLVLTNFTKKKNHNIIIPIKTHKMNDKYKNIGQLNSIQLTNTHINYLYKIPGCKDDSRSKIIGADMGQRKILSFSDGQKTPNVNSQNKTFTQLENKIIRKQKNSKSYKRTIIEMKNFTREVMNKLNINNVKEIRFESNKGIKNNTGNAHKYWQTYIIKNKLKFMCQDNHVDYTLTLPAFKSQRCFKCGYVHKKNRMGEKFVCLKCFHTDDADHNSASNNALILPYTNLWSYHKHNNNSGFYWNLNDISIYSNIQIGHAELPNTN